MAAKTSIKRKDASTWLAYGIITWATLLGTHYAVVEKENREYRSCAAELSQNKENLTAMRRLYAVAVSEKMKQAPNVGALSIIDVVHKDLVKQFSDRNDDKALLAMRAGNVIQKELSTLCVHTGRWEFDQILMVYPYVDETQLLWEKSNPEDVNKRIARYHSVVQEAIRRGLEQIR